MKTNQFIDEKDFNKKHLEYRKEAISQYDVEKKRFGYDTFQTDYKNMLLEKIDAAYKHLSEMNKSRDVSYFFKRSGIATGVTFTSAIASAALVTAETTVIAGTGALVAAPVAAAAGLTAAGYFLYGTYKYYTQVRS